MHLPRAVMASLTSIIIPLYQYPPSSTSCWPDINAVLQASGTSTQFIFIANPSSGPIVDPTDLYLRCLPSLRNQGAPVSLVGYVRTGYGSRSVTDVQKDVQTYESWKNLWVSPVVPPGSSNTVKRSDGADDAVSNDGKIPNEERSVVRKKKAKKASKARKNKKKGKQARKGGRRDTNGGGADPSKATLGLEGIFFDEVSQEAKDVATYAGYAKEVRSGGWKSAFGQVRVSAPCIVAESAHQAVAWQRLSSIRGSCRTPATSPSQTSSSLSKTLPSLTGSSFVPSRRRRDVLTIQG